MNDPKMSNIYRHGVLAGAAPPEHTARLNDLFAMLRSEFDAVASSSTGLKDTIAEYEGRIAAQMQEMGAFRNSLFDLEQQHQKIKQSYEDEIMRLRRELDGQRGPVGPRGPGQGQYNGMPMPGQNQMLPQPPPLGLGGPPGMGPNGPTSAGHGGPLLFGTMGMNPGETRDYGGPGPGGPSPYPNGGPHSHEHPSKRPARHDNGDRGTPPPPHVKGGPSGSSGSKRAGGSGNNASSGPGPDTKQARRLPPAGRLSPGPPPSSQQQQQPQPAPLGARQGVGNSSAPGSNQPQSLPSPASMHQPQPSQGQHQQQQQQSQSQQQQQQQQQQNLPMPGKNNFPPGSGAPNTSGTGTVFQGGLLDVDPDSLSNEYKAIGSDWHVIYDRKAARGTSVHLLHTLKHDSVVCCVRFSQDGKYLATGCDKSAQIYDTKTGQKTCTLMEENPSNLGDLFIRTVCFSPNGKYLATGAEDRQIRIWDIAKKRIFHQLKGHKQEIYSLDFSKDGRIIVSGSGDKTAKIWDMESGRCISTLSIEDVIVADGGPLDAGVTSVTISHDGKFVAAGSLDTIVRVWDVATGFQLERLRGHKDSVYSVAFAPDNKTLVSGSLDQTIKVWDLTGASQQSERKRRGEDAKTGTSHCASTFVGHKDYVLSVAVSPDGKYIVSGSKDRGVQFWDFQGNVYFMLQGHGNSVISTDIASTGSLLATGSGDKEARIWSFSLGADSMRR